MITAVRRFQREEFRHYRQSLQMRKASYIPGQAPFLEQFRSHILAARLAERTADSYVDYVRQFILFHGKRHPDTMGADEVRSWLTYIATRPINPVSASTQNAPHERTPDK